MIYFILTIVVCLTILWYIKYDNYKQEKEISDEIRKQQRVLLSIYIDAIKHQYNAKVIEDNIGALFISIDGVSIFQSPKYDTRGPGDILTDLINSVELYIKINKKLPKKEKQRRLGIEKTLLKSSRTLQNLQTT